MRTVNPEKHEKKRLEILAAAKRCFIRDGFRGASIASICAEAKISPGHLYHYFASKEAIIEAITKESLNRAIASKRHIKKNEDRVTALLAELQDKEYLRNKGLCTFRFEMFAEAGRNRSIGNILKKQGQMLLEFLAEFIRDGQEDGQIDPSLDVKIAAATLLSIIDGANTLFLRDPTLNEDDGLALLDTLLRRFLLPPPKQEKNNK
jgi:TetR/AcrR family transcriptional regulator, repressor for uid operon